MKIHMKSIDEVEISPSRAFDMDRPPFHPVMKVVSYGVDDTGKAFVEIQSPPTKVSMFGENGPCEFASADVVTIMSPDELTMWRDHFHLMAKTNERPLTPEMLQILDFYGECARLGQEAGSDEELRLPAPETPRNG